MNNTPTKKPSARLQHVVAHLTDEHVPSEHTWDETLIFGTELEALRHIIGKTNWYYVAVTHGQSLADAISQKLKAARS